MGKASLVILALFGICWGACPVNPNRFKHSHSQAIVSFAGPFANLLLMLVFSFLSLPALLGLSILGVGSETLVDATLNFLFIGATVNAVLFLLNMIPLPPLDGHQIAETFFPQLIPFYNKIGSYGLLILMAFFWLPIGFDKWFWGSANWLAKLSFSVGLSTNQWFLNS